MARESWLRSYDHERFADAMMKCRHPFGLCAHDGRCHYGGCFRRLSEKPDELEVRLKAIEQRLDGLAAKIEAMADEARGR